MKLNDQLNAKVLIFSKCLNGSVQKAGFGRQNRMKSTNLLYKIKLQLKSQRFRSKELK